MRALFLFILLTISINVSAQNTAFSIKGTVQSAEDETKFESATIHLEQLNDNSLVTYTLSNTGGDFIIEDSTDKKELNLFVSYVGYKTFRKKITIANKPINLGIIKLQLNNALDEVVIKTAAPVTIKKDTLEFNVKSFKTKKDANVEDLLKELPGVEVDEDGKITINGKEVNKILVNGKPFFGNDPTITTKNLTKDIIEKIQIVDTKTKTEAYTSKKGDGENKTINLTIKEENNKGVFGRVAAGAGTDERWEFAGLFNYFNNDRRISVLAGGNNINSVGFSFGEISKMFGNSGNSSWSKNGFTIGGRSFGGGQGITTSKNSGFNYADKIDKGDISTNYFYTTSNSENKTALTRETFLANQSFFNNSNSNSNNDTDSHTVNIDYDINIDSTMFLNIKPKFNLSKSETTYESFQESLDSDNNKTNSSDNSTYNKLTAQEFGNTIALTKKIGKRGAHVSFNLNNSTNKQFGEDLLNSETLFTNGSPNIIRNQKTNIDNSTNIIGSSINGKIPLYKENFSLLLESNFTQNNQENKRSTFDYNSITNKYNTFNTDLSSDFTFKNETNSQGVGLNYSTKKLYAQVVVLQSNRTLKSEDVLRPQVNVLRHFKNLALRSSFNYTISKSMGIHANYSINNTPANINQLQAFKNVSNPLNTIIGNTDLKLIKTHRAYMSFNNYDWKKRTGFYFYSGFKIQENQIVSKTVVNSNLERTTTYTNVNGNYTGYFGGSYNKSIKLDKLRSIKIRLSTNTNLSNTVNFNNGIQYKTSLLILRPRIITSFKWKKLFDITPSYQYVITQSKYSLANLKDQNFVTHKLNLRTATYFPKRIEWRNNIKYTYNPNIANGLQNSSLFWNSSVSYAFIKDKALITLKVYDLLNQNTNALRIANNDYVEDRESTVLKQYFMLNLSWKFNSLGNKGETKRYRYH